MIHLGCRPFVLTVGIIVTLIPAVGPTVATAFASSTPSATVTPHGDLINGQFVELSWRNFAHDRSVYVRQCDSKPKGRSDCSSTLLNGYSDANGAGSLFVQLKTGKIGHFRCDFKNPCTLVVFQRNNDFSGIAKAPLRFAFPPDKCPKRPSDIVSGSGSASAMRAMYAWEAEVCRPPSSLPIDYTVKNSPDGRHDFISGLTDFAITTSPFEAFEKSELTAAHKGYEYAPLTASGLVFGYNIYDRNTGERITNLKLTPELLAKVFTGQIANWNDPEITSLNPGIAFPSIVKWVGRADNSGQTLELTSWFEQVAKAAYEAGGLAFQGGATDTFPATCIDCLKTGAAAVAREVATPSDYSDRFQFGQIGWMDSSTAALYGLPTVRIPNASGKWVTATPKTIDAALLATKLGSDNIADLDFQSSEANAYPLPIITYLVAPTSLAEGKQTTLGAFLRFVAGQKSSDLVDGYAPLPKGFRNATISVAGDISSPIGQTPGSQPPGSTSNPNGSDAGSAPASSNPLSTSASSNGSGSPSLGGTAPNGADGGGPTSNDGGSSPHQSGGGRTAPIPITGYEVAAAATGSPSQVLLPLLLALGVLALLVGPVLLAVDTKVLSHIRPLMRRIERR